MSRYTYTDPLKDGRHKQFYLTKRQHNQFFLNRKIKWHDKYEYYYNENHIILHKFINWKGIACNTVMSPFLLLFYGIANTKEFIKDLNELYHQKQTGSFVADHVSSRTELYGEIMNVIGDKS